MKNLFCGFGICGQKERIADILMQKYLPEKAEELFALFARDPFAKIKQRAVRLGKACGFDTRSFLTDADGHVRKEASL